MIGIVAGLIGGLSVICPGSGILRVDDPVGAIAVHGVCGMWGALALGIFADGSYGMGWNGVQGTVRGLLFGDPGQFVAQLIGVTTNLIVVFGLLTFAIIERTTAN